MFWKGHVGGLWSVLRRIEICLHVGTLGARERFDDECVVSASFGFRVMGVEETMCERFERQVKFRVSACNFNLRV